MNFWEECRPEIVAVLILLGLVGAAAGFVYWYETKYPCTKYVQSTCYSSVCTSMTQNGCLTSISLPYDCMQCVERTK